MNDVVTNIRDDRICMDCGKQFLLAHAAVRRIKFETDEPEQEGVTVCPRCSSPKHIEYVKAEHENISTEVPEGYVEHPLEVKARELFDRVTALTGWREVKVRLWFQLSNPLLGNVSPEWMIMNLRAERLERFIDEAEELNNEQNT